MGRIEWEDYYCKINVEAVSISESESACSCVWEMSFCHSSFNPYHIAQHRRSYLSSSLGFINFSTFTFLALSEVLWFNFIIKQRTKDKEWIAAIIALNHGLTVNLQINFKPFLRLKSQLGI